MQQTKGVARLPVETTLMLIGDKWKVLILRDLMPGTKRFGELKKSIGSVSQKVLTPCHSGYEKKRALSIAKYTQRSRHGEYSLTDLGKKPETNPGCHVDLGRGL